jgi:hypothetical protein
MIWGMAWNACQRPRIDVAMTAKGYSAGAVLKQKSRSPYNYDLRLRSRGSATALSIAFK